MSTNMQASEGSQTQSADGQIDELLTFIVEGQQYGVDILRVQEIRGWESVTRIPNTPNYVRGVLNLRGAIVPIIDLRTRLGLDTVEYDETTVIVVLQVMLESGTRTTGVVVDAVSDVCAVSQDSIQEAPEFGTQVDTRFLRGMATHDDSLVIILEVDHLLRGDVLSVDADLEAISSDGTG